jgi:hypothetical protein
MCVVIAISLSLRFYFIWENKRRDQLYGTATAVSAAGHGTGTMNKDTEAEKQLPVGEADPAVPIL